MCQFNLITVTAFTGRVPHQPATQPDLDGSQILQPIANVGVRFVRPIMQGTSIVGSVEPSGWWWLHGKYRFTRSAKSDEW